MNKRQKKKKLSVRKQLRKEKLKFEGLCYAHDRLKEELEKRDRIIRRLGSDEALEVMKYEGAEEITAETATPQQWGNYVALTSELTDELIEQSQNELALSIVKGLMEHNLIQFIVKNKGYLDDPLCRWSTVAAKMIAVPWYQMAKRK